MPSIVFDRFELGLDLRKDKSSADSNRLRELTNAYVTSGWTVRKRPGMRYVGDAPDDSAGLTPYSGSLYCYHKSLDQETTLNNGTPLITKPLPNPDDATLEVTRQNEADVFNGFIFVSVQYSDGSNKMHYIDTDENPTGPWVIAADEGCPHSEAFTILHSKVYAISDDTVPYSKTDDPTIWYDDTDPGNEAVEDAGFLPTGVRAPGDPEPLALGEFNGQLTVLQRDSVQIWNVDPDPDKIALDRVIRNVGTPYPQSVSPVSNDLYFLSSYGFRSIAQQKYTEQYQDVDVGAAIDEVVVPHLEDNSTARPVSVFFGRNGQYWCAVNNVVWVYTFSRTSKVSAWCKYVLPFNVDDLANLGNRMYVRAGNKIYLADVDYYLDDGNAFEVDFLMAFQHFKEGGVLKIIQGMDTALVGTGRVATRYLIDEGIPGEPPYEEETDYIESTGDSRAAPMTPVEVVAEQVAAHILHEADEPFEINQVQYWYEKMGPT